MTTLPTDVACRRPVDLVIVDSRTGRDFDVPFPVIPVDDQQVEQFLTAERARRVHRQAPQPLSRSVEVILRVGAALFLLMAGVQAWFAATGTHP